MEKYILKKLNTEQQKLVEQNHNLIYSFMNKNHLPFDAVEDWYGACAEALCKAALFFNPKKNIAFSTLAYVCMSNEMKQIFRKQDKEIKDTYSLNYKVTENIKLEDCIPDEHNEFRNIEVYEILNKHYDKLTDRNKKIINDYIQTEKTLTEIGQDYELSKGAVSKIYNKFLNNIYSDLYESEGR